MEASDPDTTTGEVEGRTPPATSQPQVPAQTDPTQTPRSNPPPSPPTQLLTRPQPAEKHSRETNDLEPDSAASAKKKRPRLAETHQDTNAAEPATAAGPATTNTVARRGGSTGRGRGRGRGRGGGRAKQTPSESAVTRRTRSSAQECEYLFLYSNTSNTANHCTLLGHATAERMHACLAQ